MILHPIIDLLKRIVVALPDYGRSGIAWKKVGEVQNMSGNNQNLSNIATFDVPDLNFNCVVFKAQESDAFKAIYVVTSKTNVYGTIIMSADTYGSSYYPAILNLGYFLENRVSNDSLTFKVAHARLTGQSEQFYRNAGNFDILIGTIPFDFSDISDISSDESEG